MEIGSEILIYVDFDPKVFDFGTNFSDPNSENSNSNFSENFRIEIEIRYNRLGIFEF